jgi:hypothetical protein
MDAQTNARMDNIYSIFRDKLLLLGDLPQLGGSSVAAVLITAATACQWKICRHRHRSPPPSPAGLLLRLRRVGDVPVIDEKALCRVVCNE